MNLPISLLGLTLLVACGGEFSSGGSGEAGRGAPDASAGSSGAGGDVGSTVGTGSSSTTSGGAGATTGAGGTVASGGRAGSGGPGAGGTAGTGGAGGTAGSAGAAGARLDSGRDAPGDVGPPDGGIPCKVDGECKLVDTCCLGCVAKGTDFPVPPCNLQCLVDPCQAAGVKGVRCFQGTCSLAPECDPKGVACASVPPPCLVGEVPSVSGTCWSGHCVKASSCRTVQDCTACDPRTMLCGQTQTQLGDEFRCIDIPPACTNDLSCTCAGSYVCMPPYSTCNSDPGNRRLVCSCPTC